MTDAHVPTPLGTRVRPDAGAAPNAASSGRTDGFVRRPLALSPSRASDFKQCPLLYRYRTIDRFPETPSRAQTRGTMVHAVLEQLFDMPAALRTPDSAHLLLEGAWAAMVEGDPSLLEVVPAEATTDFLAEGVKLIDTYFQMENPTAFDADAREHHVEILSEELPLRGFIDRIDVAPTGELRVVDYKTGRSPGPMSESQALFQMKFYALAILRTRGVVPDRLQLMYLADGRELLYTPQLDELERFERTLKAIWQAITSAVRTGDFRPNKSWMCRSCDHQARCPEFGGTIPPYPGPPTLRQAS